MTRKDGEELLRSVLVDGLRRIGSDVEIREAEQE